MSRKNTTQNIIVIDWKFVLLAAQQPGSDRSWGKVSDYLESQQAKKTVD